MSHQSVDIDGKVFRNGTCMNRAIVTNQSAVALVQSDVTSMTYTIYSLSATAEDTWTAITNHTAVSVTVSAVIYNTLQTDTLWTDTVDATGYNFKHIPVVSTNAAFTVAGVFYRIVYSLVTSTVNPLLVRFKVRCY